MTWTPTASCARSGLLLLILILPSTASAALGGSTASVDADRVHVQGALMRMVRNDAYALHEIRSASGTLIREYVNSAGVVFAVAWQGAYAPDLRQVLGDRFDQYQSAMVVRQRARRLRGSITIDEPGLVVQTSGHARNFSGRAYVPALLPPGLQLETIK
jgi:hypothetical protein